MKRFIILTMFLIGNAINGFLYADTLDNYLFSQEDDSIKTLYQLCIKYNGDTSVFSCLDRLQDEAIKKKNKKLTAVAMGLLIQAFVNQNMTDSVLKYEKSVVDALRKEEEYRRMFIVQNLVIEKLISFRILLAWQWRARTLAKFINIQVDLPKRPVSIRKHFNCWKKIKTYL